MNVSRPGLHMTHGRSELILYTEQDKKESICHIASLEVIRGLEKSFEIDHSGFSLDTNGTLRVSYLYSHCNHTIDNYCMVTHINIAFNVFNVIQVNKGMLTYSLTEYAGELYRIALSTCAGDEKRFIFVIWGIANVTECKHLIMILHVFMITMRLCSGLHTYIPMQQSSIAQYPELFTVTRLTAQHLRLQLTNEDLIKAQVTNHTVINCMHKLEDAIVFMYTISGCGYCSWSFCHAGSQLALHLCCCIY